MTFELIKKQLISPPV